MKTSYIIFILIFYNHFLSCQTISISSAVGEVDIGKRKYFVVETLKDSRKVNMEDSINMTVANNDKNINTLSQDYQLKVYHVRIISADKNDVLVINPDGISSVINPKEIISIKEKPFNSPISLGIGFGLPYGLFGFNGDINIYQNLYFSAGIGVGFGTSPYLCVGGKYYLRSGSYRWRPRVFAFYGNIGGVKIDRQGSLPEIKEAYNGTFIGFGQQWMTGIKKAWGIDFDIVYIIDDGGFEAGRKELIDSGYQFDIDAHGSIKVSLGVRYIF